MIRIRTVQSCDSDHSLEISADQIDLFLGSLSPRNYHNISLLISVIFEKLILQTCLSLTARLKMFILLARPADPTAWITRVLLTPLGPIITPPPPLALQHTIRVNMHT